MERTTSGLSQGGAFGLLKELGLYGVAIDIFFAADASLLGSVLHASSPQVALRRASEF
jgi:hypothetical protein